MAGMDGTLRHVGVVLRSSSEYCLHLLEGALRYSADHPNLQLATYDYEEGIVPPWTRHMPENDGWLLWCGQQERWVERILKMKVPVVNASPGWADRVVEVVFNGVAMRQRALDHLAGLRPASVACVSSHMATERSVRIMQEQFLKEARKRGLTAHALDLGVQQSAITYPHRLTRAGKAALRQFLGRLPLPTAVWALSDGYAMAVLDVAQAMGLRVPQQVAVLGTGDWQASRFCKPTLSSLPLPGQIIGMEAMRVLDGMMAGNPPPENIVEIDPPPVAVRESTVPGVISKDKMRRVHDYIVENSRRKITVDDLLPLAGMSRAVFHKRFMEAHGRPPGEEIRRFRLERAQYYLRTTRMDVARIAELCGFDSAADFTNFVRRESGQAPTAYRAQMLKAQTA
jgi:DNA-binding LacI/PurR family transcriptional regulator